MKEPIEFLNQFLYDLWVNNPLHKLKLLMNGGVFIESPEVQYGWNVEMAIDNIEGIRISGLDIPKTYTDSLGFTKGEFKIYNKSNRPRIIAYEIYQKLMRVDTPTIDHSARGRWTNEVILVQDTKIATIPPGSYDEIEFYYRTPPVPRAHTQYNDVMALQILVAFHDIETDQVAVLRDISMAELPGEEE